MAKKSGLDARFTAATDDGLQCRTLLRVVGEKGTGKTFLALSAPGPILYQSFDFGLEGVIERFVRAGKTIYAEQYEWHPGGKDAQDSDGEFDQDYAVKLRDKFEEDFYYALDNGVRTIVWDKETDIWEMYRYAEFGGPSDAPKDYPKLNQRYMSLINAVKTYPNVNMVLIQGMKDEWGTKKKTNASGQVKDSPSPTGKRVPSGFGRLDELVFAEIMCHREGKEFFWEFGATFDPEFGKCRQNASLCGDRYGVDELGEGNMDFAHLGMLLVEDSTEDDWQ